MQFLASWIANNWHCTVTSNVIGLNIKVRPIDVVWRTREEECEVELKKILNVEELDTSAPEYFQQRMAVAKLVLDGLSVRDWEKLEADVVKIREKGHEPEVQQQCVCLVPPAGMGLMCWTQSRLASKHAEQRVHTFANKCWRKMGMLTFTVAAYRQTNGQLVVTT